MAAGATSHTRRHVALDVDIPLPRRCFQPHRPHELRFWRGHHVWGPRTSDPPWAGCAQSCPFPGDPPRPLGQPWMCVQGSPVGPRRGLHGLWAHLPGEAELIPALPPPPVGLGTLLLLGLHSTVQPHHSRLRLSLSGPHTGHHCHTKDGCPFWVPGVLRPCRCRAVPTGHTSDSS